MSAEPAGGAYREIRDVDGGEREDEATRALGRWRDRFKTLVLLAFAPFAIAAFGVTYYQVQEYQFAHNGGVALLTVSVGVAMVAGIAVMGVGRAVARLTVRKSTPFKIAELAREYEVSAESLEKTATMVEKL